MYNYSVKIFFPSCFLFTCWKPETCFSGYHGAGKDTAISALNVYKELETSSDLQGYESLSCELKSFQKDTFFVCLAK